MSTITISVNGLNTPVKTQIFLNWAFKNLFICYLQGQIKKGRKGRIALSNIRTYYEGIVIK